MTFLTLFTEAMRDLTREVSAEERQALLEFARDLDVLAAEHPGRARWKFRSWLDAGLVELIETAPPPVAREALYRLRAQLARWQAP